MSKKVQEEFRVTAYHEAAHAVMRHIAGWDVTDINICGVKDGHFFGGTKVNGTKRIRDFRSYPHEHLDCPLAGYASTVVLCDKGLLNYYDSHQAIMGAFIDGCADDIDNFKTIWNSLKWDGLDQIDERYLFHMMARSLTAPRLIGYWNSITQISDLLIEEFEVSNSDVGAFTPVHVGNESFKGSLPNR